MRRLHQELIRFQPKRRRPGRSVHDDRYYSGYRKFFAAAMPGFILASFTLPDPALSAVPTMYLWFGLYMLVSVGAFFVLDAFLKAGALAVISKDQVDHLYSTIQQAWSQKMIGGVPRTQ